MGTRFKELQESVNAKQRDLESGLGNAFKKFDMLTDAVDAMRKTIEAAMADAAANNAAAMEMMMESATAQIAPLGQPQLVSRRGARPLEWVMVRNPTKI